MTEKLTRSKSNRILGGVCGGLGEYFDIDPTLFRLGFVLLIGGPGPLAYLIAWLIIPSEGDIQEEGSETESESVEERFSQDEDDKQ